MRLFLLTGMLLWMAYGDKLMYGDEISQFQFQWYNPDLSGTDSNTYTSSGTDGEYLTDSITSSGQRLENPYTNGEQWGTTKGGDVLGVTGDFTANLAVPTGYTYFELSAASITFQGDCFSTDSTGSATYKQFGGSTQTLDVTVARVSGVYVFKATIDTPIETAGPVTFSIEGKTACESFVIITEYELIGEPVQTPSPTTTTTTTPAPVTPEPTTPQPTSAYPTQAPIEECSGEITWGDPHFQLISMINDRDTQFSYQGLGWHYYVFPCDLDWYEYWPYFLLADHARCYWKNNPKGCLNNNRLILNTKPDPIIITFNSDDGISKLEDNGNLLGLKDKYSRKSLKRNDLQFTYNDGKMQRGTVKVYYDDDEIVIDIYDIKTYRLPRTDCNRRMEGSCEECEGRLTSIRNEDDWTWYACPGCLRNLACGIMGKYIRGDCSEKDINNKRHPCYNILQKSDGTIVTKKDDDNFENFAESWEIKVVNALIEANGYTALAVDDSKARGQQPIVRKHHSQLNGRSIDISTLDGDCYNNLEKTKEMNETCRLNTIVKYEKCCEQIGLCKLLWKACIFDMCSCTAPERPSNITDEWCLNKIIHNSMNTTCGVKELWPTATPTAAPTPSPVSVIAGLPQGKSAKDLIWLYLGFVVLFVLFAVLAYWYYRKKNVGKAIVPDDGPTIEAAAPTYTHA